MVKAKSFLNRSFSAGFAATLCWTVLMYLGPVIGLHQIDIAGIFGSLLIGAPVFAFSFMWWIGMVVHFFFGSIVFPAAYVYLIYPRLIGSPWMRGAEYGLILWALSMVFFMPIVGAGVFAVSLPTAGLLIFSSLVRHLVYGTLFGALAGQATESARMTYRSKVETGSAAPTSYGFVR